MIIRALVFLNSLFFVVFFMLAGNVLADCEILNSQQKLHGHESILGGNISNEKLNTAFSTLLYSQNFQENNYQNIALSQKNSDIYYLGPGDLLEIEVFELSGLDLEVRVDESGHIKLPVVGNIQVAEMTSDQLEALLVRSYGEHHPQHLQISVFIKEYANQFTMRGSIHRAGVYQQRGKTTILWAISQAGGLTEVADRNIITLFRSSYSGQMKEYSFNYDRISKGLEEDFLIESNDVVIINLSLERVKNMKQRMQCSSQEIWEGTCLLIIALDD